MMIDENSHPILFLKIQKRAERKAKKKAKASL